MPRSRVPQGLLLLGALAWPSPAAPQADPPSGVVVQRVSRAAFTLIGAAR